LGSSGADLSWNKNIKQFYVKQKIGGKRMEYKNRWENEQNNEQNKIIQYFPQVFYYRIDKTQKKGKS
jgi:hypothetical protein